METQSLAQSTIASSQAITETKTVSSNSSIAEVALRVSMISEEGPVKMDVSRVSSEAEFAIDYDYWQNETAMLSANNFKNTHFDAIVSRGEDSVPFIYQELLKGPSLLYHALELIYPDKIKYKGYISIAQARRIWLRILRKQKVV